MLEVVDELAPALRGALNSQTLTIIDCPVEASEKLRLTQRLDMLAMPAEAHP
jgi:thiamine pyrophosphate-dependent acetolactate synthase large subunit-like protein